MLLSMFPDGLEPSDPEAVIGRLMDLQKFRDLIQTSLVSAAKMDFYHRDRVPTRDSRRWMGCRQGVCCLVV